MSTISMSSASVPVFVKMLKNARSWLDKAKVHAEHKKFDVNVLVQMRLAPDMLPFVKQIQIATDHAKGAAARLAGIDPPKFEDNETTIEQLQARIDKCVDFLATVPLDKIDGSEERAIVIPSRGGERHFKGHDYLLTYAMPNFYFHVTTAYAILRHNGVDIGKADFLAGAG